ncbi:MAG: DUF6017 domain-containing protein [Clostridiales bacterium]
MAVFRTQKKDNYTVMSNQHLQDKSLSLKAKGLLSLMLSLPETWEYTLQGLAAICKDGISSVTSAIQELEEAGYLVRQRTRTMSGRLGNIEYFIYEETQNNGCDNNQDKKIAPLSHIPKNIKPKYEKPTQVKHPQSNTKILNTKELNTNQSIYQETAIEQDSYDENEVDVTDEMENITIYEDLVKENIAFDNLCHDNPLRKDEIHGITALITETVCSQGGTIRVGKQNYPAQVVKSKFLKLNHDHVQYVMESLKNTTTKIKNIRAYLLTSLFNAVATMGTYYSTQANHDLHPNFYAI